MAFHNDKVFAQRFCEAETLGRWVLGRSHCNYALVKQGEWKIDAMSTMANTLERFFVFDGLFLEIGSRFASIRKHGLNDRSIPGFGICHHGRIAKFLQKCPGWCRLDNSLPSKQSKAEMCVDFFDQVQ
jgi:hypothetical protein